MNPGPAAATKAGGRFRIEHRLGAGGFGTVYRAYDTERRSMVALKVLRRADPDSLMRFKREFRSLADLAHPRLVALYELFSDGDDWFFTMELLRGVDFLSYVRPAATESGAAPPGHPSLYAQPTAPVDRPTLALHAMEAEADVGSPPAPPIPSSLEVARVRDALRQLAEGVQALHEAGKLHRDLKPSNVLVTHDRDLKILDFGMVLETGSREHSSASQIVGTPLYMSPEQAAGGRITSASDWYSVGVLLYQALAGQPPFFGNPIDMLSTKMSRRPRPPQELDAVVPDDLDRLCMELLDPDPGARPSGETIVGLLAPTSALLSAVPAPAPRLVGRDAHLAELHAALGAAAGGKCCLVYIHGQSGAGKTALLRQFSDEAQERDPQTVVLSGRCYHQESVPYEALDSLVDNLSQYLRALPPAEAEALVPPDARALARLFPVLLHVPAISGVFPPAEGAGSRELRRRAFAALRELFARIARRRPLVLAIDDLQWGDLDSAALILELLRAPDPPPFVLVAAYRSEEAETSPLLRALLAPEAARISAAEIRSLPVRELSAEESRALARDLLGPRGGAARVADSIAQESRGNPLFIQELARSLAEGPEHAGVSTLPARLETLIERRVERLTSKARRLLELVSVAAYPLPRGAAARAAGLEDDEPATLAALRSARLVRARGQGGTEEIETYHDRIRETVQAGLAPGELSERHRALATALEAGGLPDPERLATHVLGAGDSARAARLFAQAAERAVEALAFGRAARLYRQVLERGSWTPDEAREIRIRLGDALGNAGRGAEAARCYLEAARGEGGARFLELTRQAAEQLLRAGHVDEGLATLRTVLDAMGLRFPRTPRSALAALLALRLRFRVRGLRFRERPESTVPADTLMRIDTCWAAAIGLGFVDTIRGAVFQTRGLLMALDAGEPVRVARALAVEAAYCSTGGRRSRARTERLSNAALDLAHRLDEPRALGLAMVTHGIAAYFEGRWRDCREILDRAEALLRGRTAGAAFELDSAVYCRLFSLFCLGEVRELARVLPAFLQDAQERGDRYSLTNLRVRVSYLTRLAAADVADARRELARAMEEWSYEGFHNQHWWSLLGRAQIDLYAGEGESAWRLVSVGWGALTRTFVLRIQLISILARSLRGRAALAAALGDAGPRREALLRSVAGDARALERERMPWAEALARSLRAGIAARRGEVERAAALLAHAEASFERVHMALHAACARHRRGELLGGDEGRRLRSEAEAWLARQDVRDPVRMAAMVCG